jgi:hypothetical protein
MWFIRGLEKSPGHAPCYRQGGTVAGTNCYHCGHHLVWRALSLAGGRHAEKGVQLYHIMDLLERQNSLRPGAKALLGQLQPCVEIKTILCAERAPVGCDLK